MKKFMMVAITLIASFYSQAQVFTYHETVMTSPLMGTSILKLSGKIVIEDSSITETINGMEVNWKPTMIQKEGLTTVYTLESSTFTQRLQIAPLSSEIKSLVESGLIGKKKYKGQPVDYTHAIINVNKDNLTGAIMTCTSYVTIQN